MGRKQKSNHFAYSDVGVPDQGEAIVKSISRQAKGLRPLGLANQPLHGGNGGTAESDIGEEAMAVECDQTILNGLPISFDFFELVRCDVEPLVLIYRANLFDAGLSEGRIYTQDLADSGILRRVVEGPAEQGFDIRELRGNYWGSSPEQRMASPRAQRLVRHIKEGKDCYTNDDPCECFEECDWCQEFCR